MVQCVVFVNHLIYNIDSERKCLTDEIKTISRYCNGGMKEEQTPKDVNW